MAIDIGDAVLKVGVDKKGFDKDMKGLSGAINRHKKAIGVAMIGMGVAAIGAAVASVKAFADMGDEVQKMALKTGLSTEALSELRHAAELSGTSIQGIEKGIKRMASTLLDAEMGLATSVDALAELNLKVEDFEGLSPEDAFIKFMEAIADIEDPLKRSALAQDIFGKSGVDLLPMLANGSEGLSEMREEAHKLGIVFDQEAANAAAEFKDNLTRLDGAVNGLKFTLAREMMPALEAGIPLLEEWAIAMGPIIENTLNWHAAYDKQIKQQKAWRDVMLERQRMTGGLTHELGQSLDVLESTLRNQGLLNEQAITTISRIRDDIKARQDQKTAIEGVNEATEEQIALQQEIQDQYERTTEMVRDAIEDMEYEESAAGKLGITVDDVVKALIKKGESEEKIVEILAELGDEQDNVLKVMDAFGLSALEIADILGIEVEAIEGLIEAYEKEAEAAEESAERAIAARKSVTMGISGFTPTTYEDWLEHGGYAPWYTPEEIAADIARGGGMAQGGLITEPTLLTSLSSMKPYAVAGERGPEVVSPMGKAGITNNFNIAKLEVREEADVQRVARELFRLQQSKARLAGVV